MPQDLCDGCKRRSCHQKLFCQPPPESVEPFPIKGMAVNPGFSLVLLKHTSNADRIRQPRPGGNQAQKYFRALRARPCIQDIILQGFSRLLNQRGLAYTPCFPLKKSDFSFSPVNICQFYPDQIPGPQTCCCCKKNACPVPFSRLAVCINHS